MNETLQSIANRRSLRRFKKEQISDAELDAIITAGLQAPTGHNDRPWYLVVVQNRELIDEMSAGSKAAMQKLPMSWAVELGQNEEYHIYYHAPTAIVVAARKDAISPVADVGAAIQNMLIAAESLGIGSCWMGFTRFYFDSAEARERVGLPEDYEVHYGVALGYVPDDLKVEPRQRKYAEHFHKIG